MTVEGILQFLGLVAFEIVVAILFNAFSTMQKRKLPYLICAISPLAAMMMFHSRYIGNDSLNYYNLFLQTSRATVQDLLTNTRFEHGYFTFKLVNRSLYSQPSVAIYMYWNLYVNSINLVGI